MKLRKTTPILYVDAIEPSLAHWRERLGYEVVGEVAHGERLAFAILARDGVELMLQTFASAADDLPGLVTALRARPFALYHEVDDVEAAARLLREAQVVAGPRTTSYGAREIFVEDPAGFVHGYAQRL